MGTPALAPAISAPAEPSKLLGRTTRQSVHPPGVLLSITSRLGGENAPPARYGERFPERVVRLRTGCQFTAESAQFVYGQSAQALYGQDAQLVRR